jgi:hypothetical protein
MAASSNTGPHYVRYSTSPPPVHLDEATRVLSAEKCWKRADLVKQTFQGARAVGRAAFSMRPAGGGAHLPRQAGVGPAWLGSSIMDSCGHPHPERLSATAEPRQRPRLSVRPAPTPLPYAPTPRWRKLLASAVQAQVRVGKMESTLPCGAGEQNHVVFGFS